jgi:hypothetical protein
MDAVDDSILTVGAVDAVSHGGAAAMSDAVFAAGFGDENAGEALISLATGGSIGGEGVALPVSCLLIIAGRAIVERRAPAHPVRR